MDKISVFEMVLDGMIDNNDINNAKFGDWDMADDAINFYAKRESSLLSDDAMSDLRSAINVLIKTSNIDDARKLIND